MGYNSEYQTPPPPIKTIIHTAGEEGNSTIILCVHEQSLTGICIFPVLYLLTMDHLCTNRYLKTKKLRAYSK